MTASNENGEDGRMQRRTFGKMVAGAALAAASIKVAHAAEDLKIGAIGSLSGGGTAWGLALQRGVTLAIDEVNQAGGLKIGGQTYKPRLVMVDDQYSATGGRTAAERLINLEKVKYIIGPIGSPPSLGAVSVTNAAKVLMLSDGFSPAILKNDAHAAYNFRVMNSNLEFGPAMVKYFREHFPDVKKVALVGTNDATGQAVLPSLAKLYAAVGLQTWIEMFDRGSQEFTPLMTRMIAQNVDALDLNSNSPGDAGLLLKQARQTGFKGKIWQIGGPSVDEIIQVGGPLAEGFLSLEVFDPDDLRVSEVHRELSRQVVGHHGWAGPALEQRGEDAVRGAAPGGLARRRQGARCRGASRRLYAGTLRPGRLGRHGHLRRQPSAIAALLDRRGEGGQGDDRRDRPSREELTTGGKAACSPRSSSGRSSSMG